MTTATDRTAPPPPDETAPPPPPAPDGLGPPSTQAPPDPTSRAVDPADGERDEAAGPSWRERLPEVVGGIGAVLVAAAAVGFLSASWEELARPGRALVLGGASAGLSAGALWLESRLADRFRGLTAMLWVAGTAMLASAVVLAASVPLDGMARLTALAGGLAAAAHGLVGLRRDRASAVRQLGVVGGLLLAAGTFGTSVGDRVDWGVLEQALTPLAGLVDLTLTSDAYLITGFAHLAVGALWLAWSARRTGAARRLASVGGTTLVAYAALQLHVLSAPIGAFVALLVVLAYLVHGLVAERGGLVVAGSAGVLVAGGRVIWALFSGEVVVTVAALAVGLALLAWAVHARSAEDPSG